MIEHALAEHEVRERFAHAAARDCPRHRRTVGLQIRDVLLERDRGHTHVLAALHEQHGALPAGICDAIAIRWSADAGATDDLALVQALDEIDGRLHDRELQTQALRDFDPRKLTGVVQQLQQQLNDEIKGEPGRFERHRRPRMERRGAITRIPRIVCQHVRRHRAVPSRSCRRV